MFRNLILPVVLLVAAFKSYAQSELTLPFMESVYQSSYINPASVPDHKLSIGIPGLSSIRVGVTNTGFTLNDLVVNKTDTAIHFGASKLIKELRKKNYIYAGTSIDLFHIRVKAKDNFFSFHINENVNVRFGYPLDLIKAPWLGNGEYIGDKIDFSGLSFDAVHYREYALGFQRHEEKKPYSFGGRLKLLQGLANVNWKNKAFCLETSSDMYHLTVESDGVLNTNLPVVITDSSTTSTLQPGREVQDYLLNFQNKGLALDLGGEYRYSHKLTFSAAITNLGYIKWKTNPYNYQIQGKATFVGFDPTGELYNDSTTDYLDTLQSSFKLTKTQDKYSTWLPARLYINGRYKLLSQTEVGLGIFMEKYKAIRPGFTLALNQRAGKWFEGVLSYSVQYRTYNNIGLGLMVKPGPFQFYFAADKIFHGLTNMNIGDSAYTLPMNSKFFNFRFGMNLVFGRIRVPVKQPLPQE